MKDELLTEARELLAQIREKRRELAPLLERGAVLERDLDDSLVRTCEKIRCDWVMFKFTTGRTDSLPYARATALQDQSKGRIVHEFEKIFEKRWHVEPDPPELIELREELNGGPR